MGTCAMTIPRNGNLVDKTTQNSNNVIDKTIQNNNKELFKNKKNANNAKCNTEILSATDNFTSVCLDDPVNEKNASTNGKNTSEASEKDITEKFLFSLFDTSIMSQAERVRKINSFES